MPLKIRLSRGGAKKRPFYRVVVANSRMPRDGRFIERLGTFDPLKAKDADGRVVLDQEKAKAWIAKGAQPTDRVARLLDGLGVLTRDDAQQSQKGFAEEKGAGTRRRRGKGGHAPCLIVGIKRHGQGSHPRRPFWRPARRRRRSAAPILYRYSASHRRL